MKRILSFLLALILCFSLTACTGKEEKEAAAAALAQQRAEADAFDAAKKLLDEGHYDEAIAAFRNVGRYEDIASLIAKAEQLKDEAEAGFLFGTWLDISSGNSYIFENKGSGQIDSGLARVAFEYKCTDDVVMINSPVSCELTVSEIDGVTHLISDELDLVPEADYAALAPYDVEISMDNWQEYFDLRKVDYVEFNAFNEPEWRNNSYALVLRDEYAQQLHGVHQEAIDVSAELRYDYGWFIISGDYIRGDYDRQPTVGQPYWGFVEDTDLTCTASAYDGRDYDEANEWNLSGKVYVHFFTDDIVWEDNGIEYHQSAINGELTRIKGRITLKRTSPASGSEAEAPVEAAAPAAEAPAEAAPDPTPEVTPAPTLEPVAATGDRIYAGGDKIVWLHADGTATGAGHVPGHLQEISTWSNLTSVAVASSHTMGLREDGTVVCVNGSNLLDTDNLRDVTYIAAGKDHAAAVHSDGSCTLMGYSSQMVIGCFERYSHLTQISIGSAHSAGMNRDGQWFVAGNANYGQEDLSRNTTLKKIVCGAYHTLGLGENGRVQGVGANNYGQCETGQWTDIIDVAAGMLHTVGLRSDGTVVAAGDNNYGQCNVSDWTDIVAIACGDYFTIGVRADGQVMVAQNNGPAAAACNTAKDWQLADPVRTSGLDF